MYNKIMSNVKTKKNSKGPGRPEIADEQYWKWLEEMRPFLVQGASLYYAMDKCGLLKHETTIYEKYREKGEFSRKIDGLRSTIGELANLIGYKVLNSINAKLLEANGNYEMNNQEMQIWKTIAEKHRTAQPFFANRTEEAEAKDEDFGKVVDRVPVIEYVVPKEDEKQENKTDSETPDQAESDAEATPSVETPDGSDNE